ncbi:MAG: CDP-alcohol phosphatidyltransferase family protein [Candidatus Methylomirabilales bacterium]
MKGPSTDMNCLIIAAGRGIRFFSQEDPKPLIRLLGLSLIERVILAAHSAGLNAYTVVSGYKGERVREALDQLAFSRNLRISHLINEDWEKENGFSVLKAKALLNENFVLLMADHIFDESVLLHLKNQPIGEDEVILAVDYNIHSNNFVDQHDVTKVLVEDDRIVDIGKDIKKYNAYDTGVFLCSPAIFPAIEESVHRGDGSLSGGIRVLAQTRKAKVVDIQDAFWIDVDDDVSLKKAEAQLLSTLKKPSDGLISRYVNRPLSTRITKHLLKTTITPNSISFVSFVLSMLGAMLFFFGGYIPLLIGATLAQLASVIDGCDGEIARLKFQMTEFGGWFDAVLDRYADGFLLLGLTYHAHAPNPGFWIIAIGFLAILGAFMNSYTAEKYDRLMQRKLDPGQYYFRMGRDLRMFLIFLGGVMNQPLTILALIALFMNTENIRRMLALYKNA